MNTNELNWLAGLLEGEGCFSIRDTLRNKGLGVSCSMTDKDVIDKIHSLVGFGSIFTVSSRQINHQIQYKWNSSKRNDVVWLIEQLLPFMGERRSNKIQEMLKFHSNHPMVRMRQEHGTLTMYAYWKCHCEKCSYAAMEDQRQRRAKRKY